jgi:lysozyme
MRGIDISAWQAGIDTVTVDADFVIVKATGGVSYVNPLFREQIDRAIESGKMVALYHFAGDSNAGTWEQEAEHFLSTVADYAGRAIMILDWEAEATEWPISWAENWLARVAERTNSVPWFYSYSSYINSHDCSSIARFPLWIAAYYNGYKPMGYQDDPPLYGGTGAWDSAVCYQYSSTGYIGGYDGRLDINKFYGSRDDWAAFYGGTDNRAETMVQLAIGVANDDSHGYSQKRRWPWEGDDFDCASLMYWSAHEAGFSVPMSGYTGTMLADFTSAGVTAIPYGTVELKRGDILLAHNNSRQHTEMYIGDGMNVGAHIAETGGVDGAPGDQNGEEISIAPNYGNWDYILRPPASGKKHYNESEEDTMQFIYRPDGKDHLCWYNGFANVKIINESQLKLIERRYREHYGKEIEHIELGDEVSPWGDTWEQLSPYYIAGSDWGEHAKLAK